MWVEIMIPIHMLWLHGLYVLHGPRCPLFKKVYLIIHPPTPGMTWTHFRNYRPFVRWRGPVMRRFDGFLDFSLNKLLDKQSVMVIWNATTSMWRHYYADDSASTQFRRLVQLAKLATEICIIGSAVYDIELHVILMSPETFCGPKYI